MSLASRIGARIERLFEYLGLLDEVDELPVDPLLFEAVAPYELPAPDPLGSIFAKLRDRDGCPHWHSHTLDDLPLGDPAKVFHCPDCGLTYREVVSATQPWKVIDYKPVTVVW